MENSIPTDLETFPENYVYKILTFEPKEGGNFSCIFRIKNLRTEEETLKWLEALEKKSRVTWRKERTYKVGRKTLLYRMDYRCQHKTLGGVQVGDKKRRLSKNTNCQATLKIKILRYFDLPNARPLDEERKVFPCEVDLHSWHNHCLNSASVLRFRDPSGATKEKLVHYFRIGHSSATARRSLQTELLLQNIDEYDVFAADSSLLPSLSTITHLYPKFKEMCKTDETLFSAEHVPAELENLLKSYCGVSSGSIAAQVTGDQTVVAICTPTMRRTVKLLPEVKELVFVHVSESIDNLNQRVYFFFTPCIVGAAPIGCIVGSRDCFGDGCMLLKHCLPAEFKGPAIFMTAEYLDEWKVLQEMWPNSRLLLSQFYILQAAWKSMLNSKLISSQDRKSLYFQLKDLIYSVDEHSLNEKITELELNVEHKKLDMYFKNSWDTKNLWASCYREGIGENRTNYDAPLFRISKDTILSQVKGQNVVQLVNFILTKYESYLQRRYLDFSMKRESNPLLKEFLLETSNTVDDDVHFHEEKNCYIFNRKNCEPHFVDADNCFCSCFIGYTGQLCKHIFTVF